MILLSENYRMLVELPWKVQIRIWKFQSLATVPTDKHPSDSLLCIMSSEGSSDVAICGKKRAVESTI